MIKIVAGLGPKVFQVRRFWKFLLVLIVVGIIVAAVVIIKSKTSQKPPTTRQSSIAVKLEKPQIMPIAEQLSYNGNIEAVQQAIITPEVSGTLKEVRVDIGDSVTANELMAVIDSSILYQDKVSALASYHNALASYKRSRELYDQKMITQSGLDTIKAAMEITRANYELAKTQLGYTRILAPFAGFIVARFQDPGALVIANQTKLFSLMDADTAKVAINLPEKDAPYITQIKRVVVIADAFPDVKYEGRISRYSQAVDTTTRTLAVQINVPNLDNTLKPGMFATAYLIIKENPEAITLPTVAILKDTSGAYVYTIANDMARRVPVQTGIEQNNRAEIVSGITPDEEIVTTGQQYLREGSKVNVQP